jgi:uncharacterized protein (TIGR02996 family)
MDKAEETWLRRLAAAPYDCGVRLAYAAWLEKRGSRRKAEMMRLSGDTVAIVGHNRTGSKLKERERKRLRAMESRLFDLSYKVDSRWIVKIDPALVIPPGLPELGVEAANTIVEFIGGEGWTYSGYGTVFETVEGASWHVSSGTAAAVLVVNHSQGVLAECLGMDPRHDEIQDRLINRFEDIGVWSQLHDEVTSLIYPASYPGFAIGLG